MHNYNAHLHHYLILTFNLTSLYSPVTSKSQLKPDNQALLMAIINSLYFFLLFLIVLLNHIKESNASVGSISAAAASGANSGGGGIRSREHGREALVMQATSGLVESS